MELSQKFNHLSLASPKKRKVTLNPFVSLCMFFFIFSFSIPGLPSFFTTWRIAVVFLCLFGLLNNRGNPNDAFIRKKALKPYRLFYLWQIVLVVQMYCIFNFMGRGSGITAESNYWNFLIFSPLIIFSFKRAFNNIVSFMKTIVLVCLVQCLIIFFSSISGGFQSFLIDCFISGDNWTVGYNGGVEGLANSGYAIGLSCYTSEGALKLSLGLLASTFLIFYQKNNRIFYFLIFTIIAIFSTLVARTGFFVSIILLAFMAFRLFKKNLVKFIIIIFLSAVFFFSLLLLIRKTDIGNSLSSIFSRMSLLLEKGIWDVFLRHYLNGSDTVIPELNNMTMWGTGIVSGQAGNGLFINADGGFFRSYFSMGFVLAVFHYSLLIALFSFYFIRTKKFRLFILAIFIFVFIGEFKEFAIYRIWFMSLIFYILTELLTLQKSNEHFLKQRKMLTSI